MCSKMTRLCVSLIVASLSVDILHASYCPGPGCCAYEDLGKRTCEGAGTSDTCDLLGYMYKGNSQFLISGTEYGLFYVWGVHFLWSQSASSILYLNTIYAYVLQVPRSNYTEHAYYLIEVTACPKITVLCSHTEGKIPTTTLLYSIIYKVVRRFANSPSCPGPCNVIAGGYRSNTKDNFNSLLVAEQGISLFFSNLVALEYDCIGGQGCRDPLSVAKKYGLRVRRGTCPSTYVQADYPKRVTQTCKKSFTSTPEGLALVEQGFPFDVLLEPGGACALSVALGSLAASATTTIPYELTYQRIVLLREPYDELFILNCLVEANFVYPSRQALWSLC